MFIKGPSASKDTDYIDTMISSEQLFSLLENLKNKEQTNNTTNSSDTEDENEMIEKKSSFSVPLPEYQFITNATVSSKFINQLNVLEAIKSKGIDPKFTGNLNFQSTGMLYDNEGQVGSCILISRDLCLVPYRCVEDTPMNIFTAQFGYFQEQKKGSEGDCFLVAGIVEFDAELGYAILKMEGDPGKKYPYSPLSFLSKNEDKMILLHHPWNEPLKFSLNTYIRTNHLGNYISPFHDAERGSAGGGYFEEKGKLVAIHLGKKRDRSSLKIVQVALPIEEILKKNPDSILHDILEGFNSELFGEPLQYLEPTPNDFVEQEKFAIRKLSPENHYLLREASENSPGILILNEQKKFTPDWPGESSKVNQKENFSSLAIDQLIALAEAMIEDIPDLKQFDPSISTQIFYWPVQREKFEKEITKKLHKIDEICIQAELNKKKNDQYYWGITFFPLLIE